MTTTLDSSTTTGDAQSRRLTRSDDGRWLAGVAAGLGRYFEVNPLVYRIAFAALVFAGGTGILLYAAAWLVIPKEDRDDSIAAEALREHRDRPWLLLGVGLLLFAALLAVTNGDFWDGPGDLWLAATFAGAAVLWWQLAHRGSPLEVSAGAARERRPSLFAPALGALLAGAGVLGLMAAADVYTVDTEVALAAAVALVGAVVAAGALTGRRVGWLVVVGLVLLAAFAGAAATPVPLSDGVGEKLERPMSAAALQDDYSFGVGELVLDLTAVELPPGETRVSVSLGVGELQVTVPDGVALELDAHAGIGEATVLEEMRDGVGTDLSASVPGGADDAPVLVLDADVGFGAVEIRRG